MSVFKFKQFDIEHTRSAMKVGTDGVLLGAWAQGENVRRILDIGTGSGLIACMMAQRFPEALIDAIDIDAEACRQSLKNVNQSPWKDRINIHHIALNDFIPIPNQGYDLIISNPPFFANGWPVEKEGRKMARDAGFLSQVDLINAAEQLMNEKGNISVIYPIKETYSFYMRCLLKKLSRKRSTKVYPKGEKSPRRILQTFTREFVAEETEETDELIIEAGNPPKFTEAYKELTRDFYLKF